MLAGQQFRYVLNVTNIGNTPATEVRLVDGLPHVGDTGVKLVNQDRETQWDPRPRLAAAPSLVPPGAIKATAQFAYTAKTKACTDELRSPPLSCPAGEWDPAFSTDAEGFRAFVTFPDRLAPGKSFAIKVPMSAPVDLNHPPNSLPIAWNSFAHTDFVLKPGATSPSQLPFVEPPKVGVALPFGTLEIDKQKTGPLAAQATGPFAAAYDCTVTPTGGSPVSVASGQGSFNVEQPLLVPDVPVGATCNVWETDTGGGVSDHSLPASAITTVITAQRNGNTSVVLANDFPQPPPVPPPPAGTPAGDAQLRISKQVDLASAAAGQPLVYTIQIVNAGPATATNVRLADNPSHPVILAATSVTQGTCTAGLPLTCALGSLPVGASTTIMVQESASSGGLLRNTAIVSADQATPTPATATSSAATDVSPGKARLRVRQTPKFRRVQPGGTFAYRIRVLPVGPLAAVGVRVCERLNPDLVVRSAPGARFAAGRPCWTIRFSSLARRGCSPSQSGRTTYPLRYESPIPPRPAQVTQSRSMRATRSQSRPNPPRRPSPDSSHSTRSMLHWITLARPDDTPNFRQTRRSRPLRFAAATVVALAASIAAAPSAVAGDRPMPIAAPSQVRGATIADIVIPVTARSQPGAGRTVWLVGTATSWSGEPQALLVLGSAEHRGRQWVHVLLPIRPNDTTGWIPRDDVTLMTTRYWITVDKRARTVTIYQTGRPIHRYQAVIGKPATPTPDGLAAIYEIDPQPDPSGFLGPWALPLTIFSNVLYNFGGGPGRVAIHGRDGASLSDPLGSARSHGCIRIDNGPIAWIATHLPQGTPVQITG